MRPQDSRLNIREEDLTKITSKSSAIDGFATGSVALTEIATLDHEAFDNAMECAPFVVKWLPSLQPKTT